MDHFDAAAGVRWLAPKEAVYLVGCLVNEIPVNEITAVFGVDGQRVNLRLNQVLKEVGPVRGLGRKAALNIQASSIRALVLKMSA